MPELPPSSSMVGSFSRILWWSFVWFDPLVRSLGDPLTRSLGDPLVILCIGRILWRPSANQARSPKSQAARRRHWTNRKQIMFMAPRPYDLFWPLHWSFGKEKAWPRLFKVVKICLLIDIQIWHFHWMVHLNVLSILKANTCGCLCCVPQSATEAAWKHQSKSKLCQRKHL